MSLYFMNIYAAAGVTSVAALCAVITNRFRNVPAGSFAIAGGVVPWLMIALLFLFDFGSRLPAPAILGLFCIGPLLLVALLCYSYEESGMSRNLSVAASGVGVVSGIGFALFLGYPFLLGD